MNKKAITEGAILSLVLAAAAFLFFFAFIMKSCQTTDQTTDSFNKLIDKIQEISSYPEEDISLGQHIYMGSNSAIVFFEANRNNFTFEAVTDPNIEALETLKGRQNGIVQKPDSSECQNKNCICLCKKLKYEYDSETNPRNIKITCGSADCRQLDIKTAELSSKSWDWDQKTYINYYSHGFIIARELWIKKNMKIEKYGELSDVSIHKYKDSINICRREPCIMTEEEWLKFQKSITIGPA